MRLTQHIRRIVSIWLVAILICLSVAVSAHSVSHLDDGVHSHCALCIHDHQLQKILLTAPPLIFAAEQFSSPESLDISFFTLPFRVYHSRAPPLFS